MAGGEGRRAAEPGLKGPAGWPLLWTITGTLAAGLAIGVGTYALLGRIVGAADDSKLTAAQHITAAFATATAVGAIVALVVNIRKQSLAEQLAERDLAAAFTERFRAAAAQLGAEAPTERLAGVYALAAVADEYSNRAQQCVDVLCGYLRLPFDPATDEVASMTRTVAHRTVSGPEVTETITLAARPRDRQVRQTILTVITDHTRGSQDQEPGPWSALNFDLTGAHLANVTWDGCTFQGWVRLSSAAFSGDARFSRAVFSGARFDGAVFSGPAWFIEAVFSGARFDGAVFSGDASFSRAVFSGDAWFKEAVFSGDASFWEAVFSVRRTDVFEDVRCYDLDALVHGATFGLESTARVPDISELGRGRAGM